jgi:hypothetical protein
MPEWSKRWRVYIVTNENQGSEQPEVVTLLLPSPVIFCGGTRRILLIQENKIYQCFDKAAFT